MATKTKCTGVDGNENNTGTLICTMESMSKERKEEVPKELPIFVSFFGM